MTGSRSQSFLLYGFEWHKVKHLSRNTNLIQDYNQKTGEVKPSKILNINKEESFNTYENRFIYTLINNMKLYIERKKKELSITKKNYYIIDTNVFVDYPDIISKIDRKYPIILSAKVTDELDRMKIKLTEERRQNAEKALRNLNNESQHEILYEFADASLLPDDFDKRSPDNMILSTALKYKEQNPIMLTSDNGLQLKSKILGISTISLKAFLKR